MPTLRLLLLAFLLLAGSRGFAQDLLTRKNGDELLVKVVEITPTEVRYRRADNPDGPLISVWKADVFMIRYANGSKEIITPAPAQSAAPALPPGGVVVPGDEEPLEESVHLNGPRIGLTVLTGDVVSKAQDELHLGPVLTQFGWQFETRIFRLPNGTSGLLEFVPLIGGLDQGKFIPSLNMLIGIRGPKGLEFGLGPNLTPVSANIALAVGTSFHSSGVNFPVNLAVVPGNGGARFSLLVGFNARRR